MAIRDPIEDKRFRPTVPTDLNDPPRFSQVTETLKDAFVYVLREFFVRVQADGRLKTIPTVAKYAYNFEPNVDPVETLIQIVEEFPDINEHLSHVAVISTAGRSKRETIGRPVIGPTQYPARVVTANAEPYALGPAPTTGTGDSFAFDSAESVVTLTDAGGAFTQSMVAGSITIAGATTAANDGTFVVLNVVNSTVIQFVNEDGVAEVFPGTYSITLPVADSYEIVYQTTPYTGYEIPDEEERNAPQVSRVVFQPRAFASILTATAAEVVEVWNNQALYARARLDEDETGVEFLAARADEQWVPHNLIEILADSTPAAVTALGLASFGTTVATNAISGTAPNMTLTVTGTPFSAVTVGEYVTLEGWFEAGNNGRFEITAKGASTLSFTNADGVVETVPGLTKSGTGDSIAVIGNLTTLTDAGATFEDGLAVITIAGATTGANDGTFDVYDVSSATTIRYVNTTAGATSEPFPGTYSARSAFPTWFVGRRDTTDNPLRPVMMREHLKWVSTVGIEVMSEDPNERRELVDLLKGWSSFLLEEQFFTILGRSFFSETVRDGDGRVIQAGENYMIDVEAQINDTGDHDVARPGGDEKDRIYACRIDIPTLSWWYIDRQVTVLTGPGEGESWTLEWENVDDDSSLPMPN